MIIEYLGLPPRLFVLIPHSHLPRLQAQLPGELKLLFRLELLVVAEARLQELHLSVSEALLLVLGVYFVAVRLGESHSINIDDDDDDDECIDLLIV